MRFTPAIAAAVLAFTSGVFAAPQGQAMTATEEQTATETAQTQQAAAQTAAPATVTLSRTAQLALADTVADRFAILDKNEDFLFDFNKQGLPPVNGAGGTLAAANRKSFPALVGTNSGMAVGRLQGCAMNTLHIHPRATELQVVVKGKITTEMVPENGVNNADGTPRVITNTLTEFQMTPFYQGSVHTQFNPECDEAIFVASFNAEDFGTGQIANETFALPDDVIGRTFGQTISGQEIDKVRMAIPKNIAAGVDECLKNCNMPKNKV